MQNEQPLLMYRTQPFDVSSSTVSGSGKSGWDRTTSAPRRACPDLVDVNVLRRVVRVTDRARHVSRVRRDVRRHAEVGWLVDVAIEDHDLHGPESMLPSR